MGEVIRPRGTGTGQPDRPAPVPVSPEVRSVQKRKRLLAGLITAIVLSLGVVVYQFLPRASAEAPRSAVTGPEVTDEAAAFGSDEWKQEQDAKSKEDQDAAVYVDPQTGR